jgi:hypothetical protein
MICCVKPKSSSEFHLWLIFEKHKGFSNLIYLIKQKNKSEKRFFKFYPNSTFKYEQTSFTKLSLDGLITLNNHEFRRINNKQVHSTENLIRKQQLKKWNSHCEIVDISYMCTRRRESCSVICASFTFCATTWSNTKRNY